MFFPNCAPGVKANNQKVTFLQSVYLEAHEAALGFLSTIFKVIILAELLAFWIIRPDLRGNNLTN